MGPLPTIIGNYDCTEGKHIKKSLQVGFILIILLFLFTINVYAIDFSKGTVFKSSVTGGNITFAEDITANSVTWTNNQVRFSNLTYNGGSPITNVGFRCPSSANVNITQCNPNTIILNHTLSGNSSLEVYLPQGEPTTITGTATNSYVSPTLYYTVTGTYPNVTISYNVTNHVITLGSPESSIQERFYILVYANSTANGNETFQINGYEFEYNEAMGRHETTINKKSAQIITLNTLTAFTSTRGHTGSLNNTIALTWTTGLITRIINNIQNGDTITVLAEEAFAGFGVTMGYTFVMIMLTVAVNMVIGYEATFIFWFIGWGAFSYNVTGTAQTMALGFFIIGIGIMLAKVYLDGRAT